MHADHTQVALYMKEVAKASNRILIETTGLLLRIDPVLLTISSPKTLLILMKSKDTKQLQIEANNSDLSDLPIVVYLGYSIHGNESSGTGAAIALAYYLLQKVQSWKTLEKLLFY
jgi:hypothetical protein